MIRSNIHGLLNSRCSINYEWMKPGPPWAVSYIHSPSWVGNFHELNGDFLGKSIETLGSSGYFWFFETGCEGVLSRGFPCCYAGNPGTILAGWNNGDLGWAQLPMKFSYKKLVDGDWTGTCFFLMTSQKQLGIIDHPNCYSLTPSFFRGVGIPPSSICRLCSL